MSHQTTTVVGVKKSTWKIAAFVLGLAVLIGLAYYYLFPRLDMKQVKRNISEFAKDSSDPVSLEYILLQGVHEIRWHRASYLQVKKIAEAGGITVETAIVDAAIEQARAYGYIN